MQFVDSAMAQRLEAAEDQPQIEIARALHRLRPELGADVREIAGGHMVYAGPKSLVGRAIGLGLNGSVTAAQLDQVEAFYRSHNAPAQVDITPLTHASLLEMLKARGYVFSELNNVMARRLEPGEKFQEDVPGLEFRPCAPDQASLWAQTMLRGFFPETIPAGWEEMLLPMAAMTNGLAMLVWAGDGAEPVAACGGLISLPHRMVALGGTSTAPRFRGHGIQTAAIGRRLNRALREGCDLAVIVTQGNTTSQRNAERLGFSLAYSKATVMRTVI